MVRHTLPIITAAAKAFKEASKTDSSSTKNGYLDSKLLHYANVETDHPYKPASVSHFRIQFPSQVQWLSLEFDNKCGFAQAEDKIINILVPRSSSSSNKDKSSSQDVSEAVVTPMMGMNFEDFYSNFQNFGLHAPAGLILLPGNVYIQCTCTYVNIYECIQKHHVHCTCILYLYMYLYQRPCGVLFLFFYLPFDLFLVFLR